MPPVYAICPSMTTIFLWSRPKIWFIHGKRIGSNSCMSMPRARSSLMCLRLRGWLFDELPNASYSALTLTPSAALAARISNRSMAMESFLKLKYSRWTEWRACLMAANKSSNFCCPVIRSVTLLPAVNTSPSRRRSMARRLSDGRPLPSSTSVPPAACA